VILTAVGGDRSTFVCVATSEDGTNFPIEVTIQDDQGSAIWQIAG
jgi:hypothetical protein